MEMCIDVWRVTILNTRIGLTMTAPLNTVVVSYLYIITITRFIMRIIHSFINRHTQSYRGAGNWQVKRQQWVTRNLILRMNQ